MKKIICLLSVVIISSCGVSKRASKLDIQEASSFEQTIKDSTNVTINRNEFLNSIIENLDLSKVIITVYNPPDSVGKQTINSVVEVNKNVKTTTTYNKDINHLEAISIGSFEETKSESEFDSHSTEEVIKQRLPTKVYLIIGFVLLLGCLYFVFKKMILK